MWEECLARPTLVDVEPRLGLLLYSAKIIPHIRELSVINAVWKGIGPVIAWILGNTVSVQKQRENEVGRDTVIMPEPGFCQC